MFAPDSATVADVVPSPNHGARRNDVAPDILLLHYTGMADAGAALARLCSSESEVSAHYVVFEDGRIVQCVPEEQRAWHAGVSAWYAGVQAASEATDINSRSIGIEIANPGHDFGYPDFPQRQIESVIALCQDILARRPIPATRVLAHSDVAPARKQDPGEKFPWRDLHAAGVGHWVEPAPLTAGGTTLTRNHAGAEVAALQSVLRSYGYGLEVTSTYDIATETVVRAFQRHFRPARVDGVADASTRRTLHDLLTQF